MNRRRFVTTIGAGLGTSQWGCSSASEPQTEAQPERNVLRIAMLHLEPQLGELDANSGLYESAIARAADSGADWILTPELGLTGYHFEEVIGLDWIQEGADQYVARLQEAAARHGVTLFLGHLEQDAADGKRYNTVFAISPSGTILGRHHKVNTIPISEDWSTPATSVQPIEVGELTTVILICADSWPPDNAASHAAQGAEILVSSATWAPEPHGPEDCWQLRSQETGLPLFVCNRTGIEGEFDMRASESVVASGGELLVRHTSEHSSILLIEWDLAAAALLDQATIDLAILA